MDDAAGQLEHYRFPVKHHFWRPAQTQFMKLEKMITLVQQERCNGDTMSTSVLKNSRVSNPAIFSKNFASGSILSISQKLFDTVYFTLPLSFQNGTTAHGD